MISLYAYSFQIYCDFSGYSDIAIGLAMLLGFNLPIKFDKPYLAVSPSEFWKRWHISLSSWLREYLYIPLGGRSTSSFLTGKNLLLTMLIGGLWHGAAWNFVFWGAFHGVLLIIVRNMLPQSVHALPSVVKIFVIFHLITCSWLLFRAPDVPTIVQFLSGLVDFSAASTLDIVGIAILLCAIVSHIQPSNTNMTLLNKFPRNLQS